jgi:amino acid adenylation domain-containing protein
VASARAPSAAGGYPDVLGLILRHAEDRPEAPALQDDAVCLSYAQLFERAGRLAAGLNALGARAGDRVAVRLPNSAAFVTLALGCLWAGAPFVPLSTDNPPARSARVLDDCQPALFVVDQRDSTGVADQPMPVVTIEELLAATSASPAPPRSVDSERDAYLIYTSGTTGEPKGVTITERALQWSVAATVELLDLDESVRSLVVGPFHFDGPYGLLFPTLVAGGTLVVPEREDLLFLRRFYNIVVQQDITLSSMTPSYLRLLVSSRHLGKLAGSKLATLILGGEQCAPDDIAKLWSVLPGLRIFNRYGPTEATIAVTSYEVTAEDLATGRIPLGVPHPGVEFFVVSEDGQIITQPGEEGELYIGGEQLMRGYWGDDRLSHAVLRTDVVPGKRLYKAGDLVSVDDHGRYFYRGRLDDVIKRNGVRISLTEVANALRRVHGVADASCVLTDVGGTASVAAFVQVGPGLAAHELIEMAGRELTANMLPDQVFVVSSLPLTPQGKVDHRRLMAEVGCRPWKAAEQAPPEAGAQP